jgi:TIR domain/HEAT repeats/NACHT domain
MGDRPSIFVSYSHADTKWLKELDRHLRGLERHANVGRFDDRQLLGGDEWNAEVKAALDGADIILLLITANFIASEYIHRVELPAALRKRMNEGCVVIPVLLETCYRKLLQIDDINYLPKDSEGALKPVAEWRGPQRARCLTQVVEHVHGQMERRHAKAVRETKAATILGIDLGLYRRRAQTKWSAIDLSALAAPGAMDADVTIRLADVFVPQLARRSRPAVSLPRDYLEKQGLNPAAETERAEQIAASWERLAPVSALELVAESRQRHLVLLGDPGAGKSAMARFVLLQLLDDVAVTGTPLAALAGHMPFLIELRDFVAREAEGRCTDLLSYLGYCGGELGFGFDQTALERHLSEQASLLIIDGLDEIFDPKRRRLMVEQIIGLVSPYPKLRLFITSRVAGFNDHPFRAAEFAVATLIDLTIKQIASFAKTWFTIVFPGDPAAAARAHGDLLDALRRRPQLRAIAGNPMILTIMATVARHKRLGRSRAALYAQALELLCYNWDYKRGLELPSDSPLIDLQAEDTLLMLRNIAWQMQAVPDGLRANAIGEGSLRGVVEGFFERDWHFDAPKARRAAGEMLERLQVRNWVLTLRGPALYGFVHRTFLEYLCALELSERFKAQQLDVQALISSYVTPRLGDDTWHEALRLLLGLLPPTVAEQVLLAILPTEISILSDVSRLAFGWQGLAEIEPRHIPLLRQACGRLTDLLYSWLTEPSFPYEGSFPYDGSSTSEGLFPYVSMRAAITDAVTGIGRIAWPAPHPPSISWPCLSGSDWFDGYTYFNLIGLLGKTVWNCPTEACKLIRASAVEDPREVSRAGALAALAEHFSEVPETKILLRVRAHDDPGPEARMAALRALADEFSDDHAIKDLLRARAFGDPDGGARGTALTALAGSFSDDPETKILLRARALEDPNADARGAALTGLAESSSDDPQTKILLRARAVGDSDAAVRSAALHALAAHFGEDHAIKDLLRTRALEDPDADARGNAFETLSWYAGDDPETKILLRARALEDPDVDARVGALRVLVYMARPSAETKLMLQERAHDDPNVEVRRAALSLLVGRFSREAETKTLLLERALNDPDALGPGVLDALSRHFGDDHAIKALLLSRARDDPDGDCRAAAFLALSRVVCGRQASILASRDLDGHLPGRDPREPISPEVIAEGAARLRQTPESVRVLFERLAEQMGVPLAFA